jgi:anti-sigma B factor antagonist
MGPELQLSVRAEPGVEVVVARGELDLSTAPLLCRGIERAAGARRRPRVVIDLRALAFCDSTGLRALIGAAQEIRALAGVMALVVAPGSQLDELLAVTGAREFLAAAASAQDALALVCESG